MSLLFNFELNAIGRGHNRGYSHGANTYFDGGDRYAYGFGGGGHHRGGRNGSLGIFSLDIFAQNHGHRSYPERVILARENYNEAYQNLCQRKEKPWIDPDLKSGTSVAAGNIGQTTQPQIQDTASAGPIQTSPLPPLEQPLLKDERKIEVFNECAPYEFSPDVLEAQKLMKDLKELSGNDGACINLGTSGECKDGLDGMFGDKTLQSVIATQDMLGMERTNGINNEFMNRIREKISELSLKPEIARNDLVITTAPTVASIPPLQL